MGFLLLLLLAALVTGGLWWFGRLRGGPLQLAVAALMVGAAGYALQGRPSLPGETAESGPKRAPLPLTEPRRAMLGQFTGAENWLTLADSYARRGDTESAVGVIQAGLKQRPNDVALHIGLGNALVDHAGMLTPAARLAYERANGLAPEHPAPRFFYGLALARSGERDRALALWREALEMTPATASYRPIIEGGVRSLEGGIAPAQAGAQ